MAAGDADEAGVVEWRLEPEARRGVTAGWSRLDPGLVTRDRRRVGGWEVAIVRVGCGDGETPIRKVRVSAGEAGGGSAELTPLV